MAAKTTLQRLREELDVIRQGVRDLVRQSPVQWFNREAGMFIILGRPDYDFRKADADQLRRQSQLKMAYSEWFERFSLLFRSPPSGLAEPMADADKSIRNWIELGDNHAIGPNQDDNARKAHEDFAPLFELLALHDGNGRVLLIPDTNALLAVADVRRFQSLNNGGPLELLLLPTVLSELDNLKIFARDQSFRDKVAKTVRRIKGWRRQGSLHVGLTLYKTITIRAIAREPRMTESLPWLDSANRDDRILASALEVQIAEPASHVVLVTSDINLQNKAEAAHLPFLETP